MGLIRIRTEVPGPKSRALMRRREAAVPRALAHSVPVFAASADGVRVTDVDDNVYLDFAGGIGVMNVGHSVPSVVAALRDQAERFSHVCFSVLPYESYISLAERLARLSPGTFPKKTLLVNSGAEAIENAVKIARHATNRPGVLCFEDGFHGRTLLALSLTSKVAPYKLGYAPFVSDVLRVPYRVLLPLRVRRRAPDVPGSPASTSSNTSSNATPIRRASPPWWWSRCWAKAGLSCPRPVICHAWRRCAGGTGFSSLPTRSRLASGELVASLRANMKASSRICW